ncbi:MAG: MFS transporter [Methanobrevibacter sp.]|nr:MFS transporter [Methanobrevibacter sp.]
MGYFLVGTTLAVGVGPYVGELIFNNLGPDNCFIAAALFAALAIICMFFVKIQEDDSQSNKKSKKDYKGIRKVFEPKAIPISVTSALLSFGYLAIISFHGVYSKDVNMANVFGYFFIIYAISLMISRPLAGKIQDKYGDWIVTVIPITLQSIGILLMAFYPSALSIVICAVCTALGFGTFYSVANSMVANIVSKDRSPYAISTYLFVVDFALGFGPGFLGLFARTGEYGPIFIVASIITVFSLPVGIFALKRM